MTELISKPTISLIHILEKYYLVEDIGFCKHEKESVDYITFSLKENVGGICDDSLAFLVSIKISSLVEYLDVHFMDIQVINDKYTLKDDNGQEISNDELIQNIQNHLKCINDAMKFNLFRQIFFTIQDIRSVVKTGEHLWFIHVCKSLV